MPAGHGASTRDPRTAPDRQSLFACGFQARQGVIGVTGSAAADWRAAESEPCGPDSATASQLGAGLSGGWHQPELGHKVDLVEVKVAGDDQAVPHLCYQGKLPLEGLARGRHVSSLRLPLPCVGPFEDALLDEGIVADHLVDDRDLGIGKGGEPGLVVFLARLASTPFCPAGGAGGGCHTSVWSSDASLLASWAL